MRLQINGEDRQFDGPMTVTQLLHALGMATDRVAVEVNRTVIPKARHQEHALDEGDVVELVTFVGGG